MEREFIQIFKDILFFSLPGGFVGSAGAWLLNRKKNRNGFLQELQSSIDLLSEKNADLLSKITEMSDEVLTLRSNNKALLLGQQELKKENAALREEIASLREQLSGVKTITKIKS